MLIRQRRLLTWIALWAMLATALLPTVSHALTSVLQSVRGGASSWAEVCTPQGMRLVAVDASDGVPTTAPMQAAGHLEHCPLCVLAGDVPPLPAAAPAALLLPLHHAALPPLFLHAPTTLHAWRSAQPRGPPSFS